MDPRTQSWRKFTVAITVLALVFAIVSLQYARRYSIPATPAVAIYCSFILLLALALAPGVQASRSLIENAFRGRQQLLLILIWCLPYLIYAAGTRAFHPEALIRLIAVAAPAPLLYLAFPVRRLSTFSWQDALLGLAMISAVLFGALRGIWTVPVNLDFMSRLFLIVVASWTWTFVRPVPALGYQLVLSTELLKAAALNFILFAMIAVPASLALDFTRWNPHWRGPAQFCLDYLEIFLFIALLEELFFRGFLQNLLSKTFRRPWRGQLVASCLFGLSHLFHAPVPNWRYVALASVAGWFYGSAFRTSSSVVASGLTHAMVDTAWRTWFTRI